MATATSVALLTALGGTLVGGCKGANSGGESDAGSALFMPGHPAEGGGVWPAATAGTATGAPPGSAEPEHRESSASGVVPSMQGLGAPSAVPVVPWVVTSQADPERTRPFAETPQPADRREGPELVFGTPRVTGGLLGDIDPALRRMRAGFLACYARSLEDGENTRRTATLSLHMAVMPNGSVRSARAEGTAGIAPGPVDCIVRRAQTATFPASGGDPADVVLPLTLRP